MTLPLPEPGADPQEIADWLELTAAAAGMPVPLKQVNAGLEIAEDEEPEEIHGEDDLAEAREQAVVSALHERRSLLGPAYPFVLDQDGATLTPEEHLDSGGAAYLLCLLLSQSAPGGLLEGTLEIDLRPARGLFQICATVAAAAVVHGPAISFGFPRPDHTGFHTKLLEVWDLFDDGVPHPQAPPGAPAHVKDEGIDVIAWHREADGLPGIPYVLGQAASGNNWKDKTVRAYVKVFHGFWFSKPPVTDPSPAMFIPFTLPRNEPHADFERQAEIQGQNDRLNLSLGTVYYRLRIPRGVSDGVALAADGVAPIEGVDELDAVADWVQDVIAQLSEVDIP